MSSKPSAVIRRADIPVRLDTKQAGWKVRPHVLMEVLEKIGV